MRPAASLRSSVSTSSSIPAYGEDETGKAQAGAGAPCFRRKAKDRAAHGALLP